MNRERLQHLITVMERVRDQRLAFDLTCWTGNQDDTPEPAQGSYTHTCGTSACALGWAAFDADFNAQGLLLYVDGDLMTGATHFAENRRRQLAGEDLMNDGSPQFGSFGELSAGSQFFGISAEEAAYLFMPENYDVAERSITPDHVIEHIRTVLNGEFMP